MIATDSTTCELRTWESQNPAGVELEFIRLVTATANVIEKSEGV